MKCDKNLRIIGCIALALGVSASALAKEQIKEYNLERIDIYADKVVKDKFQNIVTEQSYYRTGGDVDVVTSEEIEKKHYTTITNAVRMIPGVRVSETGYRNNNYGGGYAYSDQIMINGDPKEFLEGLFYGGEWFYYFRGHTYYIQSYYDEPNCSVIN